MDADVLDAVVGAFCWSRTGQVGDRRVIALHGKTMRGARTLSRAAPHLVAAFDHTAGTVLGQGATVFHARTIVAPAQGSPVAGSGLVGSSTSAPLPHRPYAVAAGTAR